jgi:acetyl esterase/lipase
MSMAWFQKLDLPRPGAIGIFCAGAGGFAEGDAAYITLPLGEARMPALITGTRDFALSNTLHTNVELAKIGVETRLYVWDGLFHGFFYNPSVPESQDAYRIIVRFFDQHLAGAH